MITNEQLQEARVTLAEMGRTINKLTQYVIVAQQSVVSDITITPEQKESLKNKYLNEKSELVNLYNQLP